MVQLISNELISELFNLVVPPAVQIGLVFGIAQFLFAIFFKLAFGKKTEDI